MRRVVAGARGGEKRGDEALSVPTASHLAEDRPRRRHPRRICAVRGREIVRRAGLPREIQPRIDRRREHNARTGVADNRRMRCRAPGHDAASARLVFGCHYKDRHTASMQSSAECFKVLWKVCNNVQISSLPDTTQLDKVAAIGYNG